MNRIRPAVAAVTLLVTAPLAACAPQAASTPDLPKQDMTRWVMPLDEFWSPSDMVLPNYASNLLIAQCLDEEGVEWPIPPEPTDESAYLPAPANMSSFPALTVELARRDGYRTEFAPGNFGAPTQEWVDARRELNVIAQSTPGFEPLFDACLQEARKRMDESDVSGIHNKMFGWINEAGETAARSDAAEEAGAQWQRCLKDAGYPVTLDSPRGPEGWMPDADLLDVLGIPPRWQAGDGAPQNPLTQAEIDLAVADATCRDSSGWTEAMYQAMWDAEVEIVTEHADELVRLRAQGEEHHRAALDIIAEHAPKQ